jgi:hypothetical protein
MTKLFRLVYVSRNLIAPEQMDAEVAQILRASWANNQQHGITGALLHSSDAFAQTLEGPTAAVETTFERIQTDLRHSDVVVLEAGDASDRCFGGWAMAHAGHNFDPAASFAALTRPGSGETVLALLQDTLIRTAA